DDGLLSGYVFAERASPGPLVGLADVVGGGGDDQLRGSGWDVAEQVERVAEVERDVSASVPSPRDHQGPPPPDAAAQLRARLIPSTPCDPKLTRARRAGGGTPRSAPTSARARRSARARNRTPRAPARPARARSARPPREAPPRRGGRRGRAPGPPDRAPPGSGARRRAGRSRAGPRARVRSDGRAP